LLKINVVETLQICSLALESKSKGK